MSGRSAHCVRCVRPTKATVSGKFGYEGRDYEIRLCEDHGKMFDRDMLTWMRLSTEAKRAPDPVPLWQRTRRVPFPVTSNGEVVSEAKNDSYGFADQVEERMAQRGINRLDVARVLASEEKTTRRGDSFGTVIYELGNMMVMVDREKTIVDVNRRTRAKTASQ